MTSDKVCKIAFDPIYSHPLPKDHRFPMLKYELIPEQLCHQGICDPSNFFSPSLCSDDTLLLTHTKEYLQKLKEQTLSDKEQRRIGFPQSERLTLREYMITQGTIDCARYAMENGVALNVAGGTHHAFADRGEGFCLLNDFAVAANLLLKEDPLRKFLIIDLDVHQGNGTAKIFENESRVFTFSMHGAHNYPFHKEISKLDIALKEGTDDKEYLSLLHTHLAAILTNTNYDLAFYLSGVDILDSDKFGKLNISMEGCRQRDHMVFSMLKEAGIPCVVAMGGGYSPDIRRVVDAHCNTFREAREVYGV
jgi:acetoin utilization deacetylase AcuC-like enzyme